MCLSLHDKISLVTGASRGIGAATARRLASLGSEVVLNFRSKGARAEEVAADIAKLGRTALPIQADLTIESELEQMMAAIKSRFQKLDLVVLNASGGMEKGKSEEYAMSLNLDAQVRTAQLAIQMMPIGGRIVFVTSHWAHFYGQKPIMAEYELVAKSKQAGERALREQIGDWNKLGISLIIVSGDLIEGTITPRLLERKQPGLIEHRRAEARRLPTVDEFAEMIVRAAAKTSLPSGHTIFVGSTEY